MRFPSGKNAVGRRGEEYEGIKHLLAARCELTWAYVTAVVTVRPVMARQQGMLLHDAIFRLTRSCRTRTRLVWPIASRRPFTLRGSSADVPHYIHTQLRADLGPRCGAVEPRSR